MGKKASLRISLDYDLGEDDYLSHLDDGVDYEDDDFPQPARDPNPNPKTEPLTKAQPVAKPKTSTVHGSYSRPSPRRGEGGIGNDIKVRMYHKRIVGRPFSTVLLEQGHESVLLYVASFLRMRCISALSCVNRYLDSTLAKEELYCRSSLSNMLFPCMIDSHIPPVPSLSSTRLARSLALDSTLFRKHPNLSRGRALVEVQTIHCDEGILESMLSPCGSSVVFVSNEGEVCSYKISNTPRDKNGVIKPTFRRRISPKESLGVISSSLSGRHCAILFMPSIGLRRYVLSVASIDPKTMASWQEDIPQSIAFGSSLLRGTIAGRQPSIKIDATGRWIVMVFHCHILVYSIQERQLLWECSLQKDDQDWQAWAFHGHYIVSVTAKGKRLLVYCLKRRCLVAEGSSLTKQKKTVQRIFSMQDPSTPTVVVYGDRIWFTWHFNLYCTGCIFRRLGRFEANITERDQCIQPLQIKQFSIVTSLSSRQALLKEFTGMLYLTDGNIIKMYSKDSLGTDSSIRPCYALSAEDRVGFLQADSTKIVCGIKGEKKYRIEIFLRPDVACNSKAWYHSVFIKSATVFCNRYRFKHIEFRSGRMLLETTKTTDQYEHGHYAARSQLRIYNLFGDWEE